ncbi:MAG: T9SS type A sorting domain-containing protein [Bacteroidales bacterium]|nr:T9SS type A sorting domain-containing protein [Bacteroidales bacterium]
MRFLFSISFFVIYVTSFCCAQITKFPTKEDSPIWLYSYNEYKVDGNFDVQPTGKYIYKIYGIKGDTIIQEKEYNKLYLLNDTLFSENDKYIGGIRNEENKIYFAEENNTEFLLYDFSKRFEVNNTIFIEDRYSDEGYHQSIPAIVQEIDLLNNYRQYQLFSPETYYYGGSWIENIGSEYDLIENLFTDAECLLCINEKGLRCLKTNEKMSYPLGKSDCFKTYYQKNKTSLEQNIIKSSYTFTNPVKDYLIITLPTNNNEIKIFDMQGKMVLQTECGEMASINVSMLPKGVYTLVVNNIGSQIFIKQ